MSEIWLQSNRRAALGPSLVFLPIAVGDAVLAYEIYEQFGFGWFCLAATVSVAILVALCLFLWRRLTSPRLTFDGENLLFNVAKGTPVAVPIEFVEGFLLGQGPAFLRFRDDGKTETTTLVVRIAERAEEFAKVETVTPLAAWCGHYVTLRGTWTEPLSVDVVNRLNQRLYEVQHATVTS